MKKLRLVVEELAVESFATADRTAPQGTVRAHATEMGASCEFEPSCGPETCGNAYCIRQTDNVNLCGGGSGACGGTTSPPATGLPSCVGCTTFDYTANPADDSCGWCASRESDAPARCRCI
jgi:hypothetical protein